MSTNVKVANALPASTFSFTSTSYVDLLNGSAGSVISVTLTKEAGTDILIHGDAGFIQNASNDTVTLGVNDGTTDYYVAESRIFATSRSQCAGGTIITGLAAGTYTFKLRVKLATGNQCNFTNELSASLMAMEIAS